MNTNTGDAPGWLAALSDDLAAIAERLRNSVVEVRTHNHGGGAGTIWREDGLIVTNHHVAPRDEATVTLRDGRELQATAVARDPDNDLAVLRVPAAGLSAAPLGDARAARAGELVLAVGHPYGVRAAVSAGVISVALPNARSGGERELIRAAVALGPGNSGGPLADARGRVIGLNAMVSGGLALAVPTHLAERLVSGREDRPRLGVVVRDVQLSPALAAAGGHGEARTAVLVVEVRQDSPADRAGLLVGDILLALDGVALAGTRALPTALAAASADFARLQLLRGGRPHELSVQLRESTASRAA